MKTLAAVISLALGVSTATVLAAGDPVALGKKKSAACAACHGTDGNSVNPEWPKLAGQHANYIAKQLRDYQSDKREDATMKGMAAALSDQDMENLGAYFASQSVTTGEADPDLVGMGERIYRGGNPQTGLAACMGCHGPSGAGNPSSNFPAVAGQHAKYTAATLRHFRDETRANDPNKMMRMVAAKMSPKEIEAVASYMEGLY